MNNDNNGSSSKSFDYDSLVEESLKNMVKRVLNITSETGLVGNSHFFITFNGNDPDVLVPAELKSSGSTEIKIIIQHQFWDLKTSEDHFEVTLSFSGKKKNISVPFKAITSFTDPSVGFGLQFKIEDNSKNTSLSKIESLEPSNPKITNSDDSDLKSGEIVSLDEFRDKK